MMDAEVLRQTLEEIDGGSYKSYRRIRGAWAMPGFTLYVDHVQSDPYAAPSRLRARISAGDAGYDRSLWRDPVRRVALEDYIARAFARAVRKHVRGGRGTGKSGFVGVDSGGQEIIERTAAVVNEAWVEVRLVVGLPASGRRCLGGEAVAIFFDELVRVTADSLPSGAHDQDEVRRHVETAEDQEWLRRQLESLGLVAFVAAGSVLPRQSGVSDRPLTDGTVIQFTPPSELTVAVELPNRGRVEGMGIPPGVTLIVGGGYHGKSTLLRALERGVYSHVPGDGREFVAARRDAVKIRAEDGRRIEKVDISPFINNLPFGTDTRAFSTGNASGSTSQAANIIEALEAGCRLLLLDEDTSATNFMIRDRSMQRLIAREREPITPFIDQVRALYEEHGVSTIMVMGGSGDYFDVADTVIAMEEYRPRVVTEEARRISAERRDRRVSERAGDFRGRTRRSPQPASINPRRGRKEKVSARGTDQLVFGRESVDLTAVEQLVDPSQTRAIGAIVRYGLARGCLDGERSIGEVLDCLLGDVAKWGLDVISPYASDPGSAPEPDAAADAADGAAPAGQDGDGCAHPGDYALPRRHEIAAMLNRMRSLRVELK